MRRGANDSSTAPMDRRTAAAQRQEVPHVRKIRSAKDCWQNKSKSKGKDSKGKGGKKGEDKSNEKTDEDVCMKCGQRGHWAKFCLNPAKAIRGLVGQNDASNGWWQWNDGQEWKAPSEWSPAES